MGGPKPPVLPITPSGTKVCFRTDIKSELLKVVYCKICTFVTGAILHRPDLATGSHFAIFTKQQPPVGGLSQPRRDTVDPKGRNRSPRYPVRQSDFQLRDKLPDSHRLINLIFFFL